MCCAHFANVKSFDAHLVADDDSEVISCQDPAKLIRRDGRPRLTTRHTRWGVTWRLAFYGTRPEFESHSDD